VLTFDAQGVSGHPNHRDTSAGVAEAAAQSGGGSSSSISGEDNSIHSVWQLRSEPLALKFLGPVGAALAALLALLGRRKSGGAAPPPPPPPPLVAIVPARAPVLASLRAMRLHASQWVWFRWLFVAFSSYGWVNVLERVDVGRRR
jgi:N-acetylglucosaminylphosphatidylinositol deacetylase